MENIELLMQAMEVQQNVVSQLVEQNKLLSARLEMAEMRISRLAMTIEHEKLVTYGR